MLNRCLSEALAHAYLDAKEAVLAAGYASEVDWQEDRRFENLTESEFLHEYAWVVFSSGFRESILRTKFPALRVAFREFESAEAVWKDRLCCRRRAIKVFGHRGKVDAILECCGRIREEGFGTVRQTLSCKGADFLEELPYIGPVTALHLAKNIGVDVVKPDRHLLRIARENGFNNPLEMCTLIRDRVGDTLAVIDLVIWRYATLGHSVTAFPNVGGSAF